MARVAARVVEVREAVAKAATTGEAEMAAAATAAVATAEVATEAVRVAGGGGNGGGDGGCGFLEGRLGPLELSGAQFPRAGVWTASTRHSRTNSVRAA